MQFSDLFLYLVYLFTWFLELVCSLRFIPSVMLSPQFLSTIIPISIALLLFYIGNGGRCIAWDRPLFILVFNVKYRY